MKTKTKAPAKKTTPRESKIKKLGPPPIVKKKAPPARKKAPTAVQMIHELHATFNATPAETTKTKPAPAKKASETTGTLQKERNEMSLVEKAQLKGVTPAVRDAFDAWTKGTPIADLSAKVGVKRSKLRRLFIAIAGGKEKFSELRGAGSGGRSTPPTRTKREASSITPIPLMDDSQVPRVASMKKTDGWTFHARHVGDEQIIIATHPETGDSYVKARPNEKADLIHESRPDQGIPEIRLRIYERSATKRKEEKVEKTIARGEAALKSKRVAKKNERELRTGRK